AAERDEAARPLELVPAALAGMVATAASGERTVGGATSTGTVVRCDTLTVLRRSGLLLALTTLLAGCSIDRVEWESTGFPVEEVTHALKEENHVAHPAVECIKREAGGAAWECRAH